MFSLDSLRNDQFSWKAALSLALASKLAYENRNAVEEVTTGGWGFAWNRILDTGDTQGFIAGADGVLLVAFRGTESKGDWIGNLDLLPVPTPNGPVHGGFVGAYELVKQDIEAALALGGAGPRKVWLTGHSLGGALATIAAADLKDRLSITGIHTFGQPRLASRTFRDFIGTHYGNRFKRFVNDDDIVPRVPPGYEHVGKLVHFDANGNIRQPAFESAAEAVEPPPLTKEEYEELKRKIKLVEAHLRIEGRSTREAALDATVEGLIPSLSDHNLDRYIALVRRYATGGARETVIDLDSSIRSGLEARHEGEPTARGRRGDGVPILIRLMDPQWKSPPGLVIGSRMGNILSANATIEALRSLERDSNVISIEVSRDGGRKEVATSVPFVGATNVHRPPIDEKGDAALIGIIDSGIDVLHEAFRDAEGKTRILAVWNQLADAPNRNPNALDQRFDHTNGTLYLAADIQTFIDGTAPTPAVLRDPEWHGTHVSSIAAGRAVGTLADGMAPEASIVVVIPKMRALPGDPWSVGYSTSHFDALTFLRRVADGGTIVSVERKPMAVNVSLGMNAGAHDGSTLLEASFDSITTKGQDPGFVIVKSAGNERGHGGHARVQAFHGLTPIQWQSTNSFRFQDYLELWYQSLDELEFVLVDPAGNRSAVVSRANRDVQQTLGGNACHMVLTERHKDNGDNRLVITIVPQTAEIQEGMWTLDVVGKKILSRTGQVDIWVERDDSARAVRFMPEVPETTLSIPGTADTVITVAACHASEPLQLIPESSFGLTRTGRPKPDICAPGFNIIAAKANDTDLRATRSDTGTSMAAPHVTGALALAMSHRHKQPGQTQHNARQLISAVNQTARHITLHNPGFGNGLLDAEALFNLLK